MEDRAAINVKSIADNVNAHCLIIHGDQDNTVHWSDANMFGEALHQCEVYIVPGANHFFSRTGQYEPVCDRIRQWLTSMVQTNPSPI